MKRSDKLKAIVIGTSHGGSDALRTIVSTLHADFPVPVIVAMHRHPNGKQRAEQQLNSVCILTVKQADEKETIQAGIIYFAPPDYHLLIEDDETFALSHDEKVIFSRPSIDVLFESAADVYGDALVAILLTGANSDGAQGLRAIKEGGGFTIVQNPEEAEASAMPLAALRLIEPGLVMTLLEIRKYLEDLANETA